ncbi:hypothetical protein HMPREF0645_0032 [Hallella bergensis DSM 17361]|uniref:Uncharacterized protein n=1 Tax=Hallella bergensis DSM 17361 TaxID=585502 RepID=D1PSX3_9BACT|nr:hypothetical protein HMPREF0645_0032 [Hallella bergensis DSM 17361]
MHRYKTSNPLFPHGATGFYIGLLLFYMPVSMFVLSGKLPFKTSH